MRKFRLRVAWGVLFILLSLGAYFVILKFFSIQEIKIIGANIQVSVDERRIPHTLLFFPSDKLRAQILSDNPALLDIRFDKIYPHTLVIVPTVRPAALLLVTPSRRVLVDSHGIVLSDADLVPNGLPQVFASLSGLRIGQQVHDTAVTSGLLFITGIQSVLPIETVTITDDGVIRAHTGNLEILFTQDSEISTILTTLQTLLTGFRIKGTLPSVIDLRFDKPVVTF